MMSEDSDSAPDDADPSSEDAVERVLDALAPFMEQADHLGGFAVKYASARSASAVKDPSTVEVRVKYPRRHPRDADMVMGMLQANGFDPDRQKRGGESNVCVVLSVDVDPDAEGDERPKPRGSGEQSTL